MISLDNNTTIEVLDHYLREDRRWRSLGGLFRRNRNNPQIYARDGRHIVVFGPFRVNPGTIAGNKVPLIQEELEEYLEKVRDELGNHYSALRPEDLTIVFSGGGSLHVPDWFMEWCRGNGFRVFFAPDPHGSHEGEKSMLDYILKLQDLFEGLEEPDPRLNEEFLDLRIQSNRPS